MSSMWKDDFCTWLNSNWFYEYLPKCDHWAITSLVAYHHRSLHRWNFIFFCKLWLESREERPYLSRNVNVRRAYSSGDLKHIVCTQLPVFSNLAFIFYIWKDHEWFLDDNRGRQSLRSQMKLQRKKLWERTYEKHGLVDFIWTSYIYNPDALNKLIHQLNNQFQWNLISKLPFPVL